MKRVLVLGCTGSIGTNTLNIANNLPQDFKICGLQYKQKLFLPLYKYIKISLNSPIKFLNSIVLVLCSKQFFIQLINVSFQ